MWVGRASEIIHRVTQKASLRSSRWYLNQHVKKARDWVSSYLEKEHSSRTVSARALRWEHVSHSNGTTLNKWGSCKMRLERERGNNRVLSYRSGCWLILWVSGRAVGGFWIQCPEPQAIAFEITCSAYVTQLYKNREISATKRLHPYREWSKMRIGPLCVLC